MSMMRLQQDSILPLEMYHKHQVLARLVNPQRASMLLVGFEVNASGAKFHSTQCSKLGRNPERIVVDSKEG
jgi:hypothetical protein